MERIIWRIKSKVKHQIQIQMANSSETDTSFKYGFVSYD